MPADFQNTAFSPDHDKPGTRQQMFDEGIPAEFIDSQSAADFEARQEDDEELTMRMLGSGVDSKIWKVEGDEMPKIVKLRYACPTCGAQMTAYDRKLVCSANGAHMWNDLAVFQGLNPAVKYEEDKPPVAPQPNHVKVEVTVPPRVKQALEEKFGSTSDIDHFRGACNAGGGRDSRLSPSWTFSG